MRDRLRTSWLAATAVAASLVLPPATCGAADEGGVAMVLATRGAAHVVGRETVRPMELLADGEVLVTGEDGSVELVLLSDRRERTVEPVSRARVGAGKVEALEGSVRLAERSTRLALPRRTSLTSRRLLGETVRDDDADDSRMLHPANFGQVRRGETTLRWELAGAPERSLVVLRDEADGELLRREVRGDSLGIPDGDGEPLEPGRSYYVEVTAVGAPHVPPALAEFRVMTPAEAAAIDESEVAARERVARAPDDPAPLMMMALIYLDAGLLDDAVTLLGDLERRMPDSPEVLRYQAHALSRAGRPREAVEARRKAERLGGS